MIASLTHRKCRSCNRRRLWLIDAGEYVLLLCGPCDLKVRER